MNRPAAQARSHDDGVEHGLLALAIAALAMVGCHAGSLGSSGPAPAPPAEATTEVESAELRQTRELVGRYGLALTAFDRGDYALAADMFAQIMLALPPEPDHDQLRHLLVQHLGWALLGCHDLDGDIAALDRGEQTLERYLVKHEALLPDAHGEREVIYALLAEYQLRRDGEPPPDANARLVALVDQTQAGFLRQLPAPHPATEDALIREIEVETFPWARLDDPRVQAFFRDPRRLGPTLFDKPGEPLHPTRVLVRGWVHRSEASAGGRPGKRAYGLLRRARPAAARCYERALSRGAEIVERVRLDLSWDASGLTEVELDGTHELDPAAQRCVREALREADRSSSTPASPASVELRLTFFVQFEQAGPGKGALDTDDDFDLLPQRDGGVPWLTL